MNKGLLMVFTGNGKGKTTAAIGMAFRALGHGLRVCLIQFIKAGGASGELKSLSRFEGLAEVHITGRGFTWASEDPEKDRIAAQRAWALAKERLLSDCYDLVVLDELTYLVKYQMVPQEEILETLARRPGSVHVAVTGRDASEALVGAADLVTDMQAVKHPYQDGIGAQRGVEF